MHNNVDRDPAVQYINDDSGVYDVRTHDVGSVSAFNPLVANFFS